MERNKYIGRFIIMVKPIGGFALMGAHTLTDLL